ncbi:iron complex outermembrane receptor protein [Pelomonas aquatica]|uniref:Iron complex outermembrane receptor protein n=1 Tax=Pelomonas aquatica TaxID=431058 RepID=A0ABU1Z3B5_9BURK|nr:TonB-dependent receptor [Pelomonas aquatica]MDR7295106.1 iron complex outermembrane receptor protein [Pelomonas aquatica]
MGLAAALALSPGLAVSQTDEDELALAYGDQRSVSIAAGSRQSLRQAPAVASVITAEAISAMGAVDLDEVLASVPGLHVGRSANQYMPLYVFRGIYSQFTAQVLLLQNGVPMTTLFVGNKGNVWAGYPVEHIARIEVIRGPGSALYGADAFAGVVNIITKTGADTPGTRVGLRGGSFKSRDAWVLHGGKLGPLDVSAYLRVGSTDGARSLIDKDAAQPAVTHAPGPINVGHDAVDANLEMGNGAWRARLGYKLRGDVGTGAGVASALDPTGKGRSERTHADLSWTEPQVTSDWGVGLQASFLHYAETATTNYVLLPPGTVLGPGNVFTDGLIGGPNKWERQLRLSGYATYSGLAGHSIRLGVGHDDLDLYKTTEYKNFNPNFSRIGTGSWADVTDFSGTALKFMLPQQRKVDYLYAQDEWRFHPDWILTAGVRRDHYSDFGATTNPRLALVWSAAYDLTVKLMHGRAFRAPSFNEQYSINNPVVGGNPAIKPETIRTTEAALAWAPADSLQLNLTLFRYAMRDIIRGAPNPAAPPANLIQNRGGQDGRGAELEVVWDASRSLRISGNYAFQRSVDQDTRLDAGYAPHHHAYLQADWAAVRGATLSGQLNHVAGRHRPAGDARAPVKDYTTLDLAARTRLGASDWELSVMLRNVFDADAREPSLAGGGIVNDLPVAPRAGYVQAQYRY